MPNTFHLLRERCIANSTKEFTARGKSVVRCEVCQLADYACICPWRPDAETSVEFVLLMHRNEVFKPTNTGRLIADAFPNQTHAFCWTRTEPPEDLISILQDENRQCLIVFPADTETKPREVITHIPASNKKITFILLDGTWKQSGRMYHLSRWLDDVPCVALPEGNLRAYAVRKSHEENYLSTAEAAGLCLQMAGDAIGATLLLNYFQLFNEHYLATRGCYPPAIGDLHKSLANGRRGTAASG